jgi:lipopolysaccharide transport system ATP-binding protein
MAGAISVSNLGKRYRIGRQSRAHASRWQSARHAVTVPFQYLASTLRDAAPEETLWALRHVSFEVGHGEVVGIIGHNGAGKSTLLKILSRITEPTEGRVLLEGRVLSLLEVGTGFHPELTGRENIYLNGAILGMKRAEIGRKLDQIVEFSEIGPMLDTAVKRYSSGMYVRLAFAVAAHLDTEILLIDEVLAVGDIAFQKKCLGKIGSSAREGRTVLFVSHNMAAVMDLCSTVHWLQGGAIRESGEPLKVIRNYVSGAILRGDVDLALHTGRRRNASPLMRRVRLLSDDQPTTTLLSGDDLVLEVDCEVESGTLSQLSLGIMFKAGIGQQLFTASMAQCHRAIPDPAGAYTLRLTVERLPLAPGSYALSLYLGDGSRDIDVIDDALSFDILWNTDLGLAFPPRPDWGPFVLPIRWSVDGLGDALGGHTLAEQLLTTAGPRPR